MTTTAWECPSPMEKAHNFFYARLVELIDAAARPAIIGYVKVIGEVDYDSRLLFTSGKVYKVQQVVWQEPDGMACVKVISDTITPLYILVNDPTCAFLGPDALAIPCDEDGN